MVPKADASCVEGEKETGLGGSKGCGVEMIGTTGGEVYGADVACGSPR